MGIEPTPPAWKAGALPLSYTRKSHRHRNSIFKLTSNLKIAISHHQHESWREQDSNLRRQSHQIYSLAPLATRVSRRNASQTRPTQSITTPRRSPEIESDSMKIPYIQRRNRRFNNRNTLLAQQNFAQVTQSSKLAVGFEPTTTGLQNRYSAVELR